MYIVVLSTNVGDSYLRNTVWTFAGARNRAQEFATREQAQAQLDKAKKFMKASHYKMARIVEL